jgi:hypothetical protein
MKMNKRLISLLGPFLLLTLLCLSAGAEDLIWEPRTPAGGGYMADPDYYFRMADAAKSGSETMQVSQTFDGHPFARGFYEATDDGRVAYYDKDGNRVDVNNVAKIEDDPDNPPNGVVYYTAPRQVVTY